MKLRIGDIALPADAVTETFAFLAKRGAGKTYAASVLVEELLAAELQVVVIDPMGAWYGLRSSADGKGPGFPIAVLGGDHGDVPLEAAAGAVVADLLVDDRLSCIIDVSAFSKGDRKRFVVDFAERLYKRNREPLHLVLEEADLFAPQRPQRGEERLLGAIEDLVRRGRGRGIGITLITQRSAVLNKDVLTQTECLVVLRTTSPHDRKAIEAWIDVHGLKEERDLVMSSLPSLPIGEAWLWSPGWLETLKRIRIRPRKTFDSSATPKAGAKRAAPKTIADVDLEEISRRMAATIEKAKATDPNELTKRIRELERDLRKASAESATSEKIVERVEVQVAPSGLEDALLVGKAMLEKAGRSMAAAAKDLGSVGELLAREARKVHDLEASGGSAKVARPATVRRVSQPPVVRSPTPAGAPSSNGHVRLGSGEYRVLVAIAQHAGGVTREQLSVLTGYKRATRNTYIQRLGAAGHVAIRDGRVLATDSGVGVLGDDYEPLPVGAALRDHWMRELPEGERRILGELVTTYPDGIAREDLSERTGYSRATRNTYIQRLGARELVDVSGQTVFASDVLFQEGA